MARHMTSIISTECTSSDDPLSGEWVLTDVADITQLGKEERIGDKGTEWILLWIFLYIVAIIRTYVIIFRSI